MKKSDFSFRSFQLLSGAIAGTLFLLIVILEGWSRQGYSAIRFPLSSLAIGPNGWIQELNFIVTGILFIIFSIGLKKELFPDKKNPRGPLLLMLVGTGLVGAGCCVTDPVYGYPADLPLALSQFTIHGHFHDGFSMLVFVCLPWSCFVFRKYFLLNKNSVWATYSLFTGIGMIIAFILTSMGFKQIQGLVDYAGLLQRTCLSIGWLWIIILSIYTYLKYRRTHINVN